MLRKNPGDILSDLIDQHLREFRVQKNPTARVMSSESADLAAEESQSDREAA
jgi:hypothetical protein